MINQFLKIIYWMSYIPSLPFWMISWIFYGVSYVICWVGNEWNYRMTEPLLKEIKKETDDEKDV